MRPVPLTILPLLILPLLAACGEAAPPEENGQPRPPGKPDAAAERVACAIAGAAEFSPVCTIDRVDSPDGPVLVLRGPGGGFRRLLVTEDGRGVVAADGALPADVKVLEGNRIEVAIGGDRYLLPATIRGGAD